MGKAGRPLTAGKAGSGLGRPTGAPAPAGAGQAGDPSRFAAGAEDIEPMGRVKKMDGLAEEERGENAANAEMLKRLFPK